MDKELQQNIMSLIKEQNQIILQAKSHLNIGLNGTLRIQRKGKFVQYYVRKNPLDTHGKYISNSEKEYIQQLAQSEYAKRILPIAEKNLRTLKLFQKNFQNEKIMGIYNQFCKEKQQLIRPYQISDEEYAANWQNEKITAKPQYPINDPIYTEKGEIVRSKSEKMLADKFFMKGIPYHYEKELVLAGDIKLHPDFTVLNKRTRKEYIWEHCGMMTDEEYCEKAIKRVELYHDNNIFPGDQLIITYETLKHPINMKAVDELIHHFLI